MGLLEDYETRFANEKRKMVLCLKAAGAVLLMCFALIVDEEPPLPKWVEYASVLGLLFSLIFIGALALSYVSLRLHLMYRRSTLSREGTEP